MLFIKSLLVATTGEDIFNEVMQYLNNENIPSTSLINIASDGAAVMNGKVKGFISTIKSVVPHIFHINYFIHRQQLVAKNIGGDMEEAHNTDIHVIILEETLKRHSILPYIQLSLSNQTQ